MWLPDFDIVLFHMRIVSGLCWSNHVNILSNLPKILMKPYNWHHRWCTEQLNKLVCTLAGINTQNNQLISRVCLLNDSIGKCVNKYGSGGFGGVYLIILTLYWARKRDESLLSDWKTLKVNDTYTYKYICISEFPTMLTRTHTHAQCMSVLLQRTHSPKKIKVN